MKEVGYKWEVDEGDGCLVRNEIEGEGARNATVLLIHNIKAKVNIL